VGFVLDGLPPLALLFLHVGAVLERAGDADVVGDDDRSRMQPAQVDEPLQVVQVHVLPVVEEYEIQTALGESVVVGENLERRPVADRAVNAGDPIGKARVRPHAAGHRGVGTQNKVRPRRTRTDIRRALLESALIEFGAEGFDGASTRTIALRVQAHQPQINYHFESKAAVWMAAADHLFGLLREAFDGVIPATLTEAGALQLAAAFADAIGRFVRFAAEHPELNQIMVHEGTAASDRLTWMTETHVKPVFDAIRPAWQILRDASVAAPIDSEIMYYVLIGAASLPYVNAPEVRLRTGQDPKNVAWIDAHANGLVAILLPGFAVSR
jgi:TetR/AcrR family transcriptional regulator